MKWIDSPGSNSACVPDIATETPRFPHDDKPPVFECFTLDQFVWNDEELALTREGYIKQRAKDEAGSSLPAMYVVDTRTEQTNEPYDGFTVDAEILVDRAGIHENFTVNDLASLLGTQSSQIHKWIAVGKVPKGRRDADITDDIGRLIMHWKRSETIEILARRLRSEHFAW